MSLNFSFGPCEIVSNASIGIISEFAIVRPSQLCYLVKLVFLNGTHTCRSLGGLIEN